MVEFLSTWQTLVGGILGGLFALLAAVIVAKWSERRQDLSSAMLVVGDLVSVRVSFRVLEEMRVEEQISDSDYLMWILDKLCWQHIKLKQSFDASAMRIYPIHPSIAAHIEVFVNAYRALQARIDQVLKEFDEERISANDPVYIQRLENQARTMLANFATAAAHADKAEKLITFLILSRIPTINKLRVMFLPPAHIKKALLRKKAPNKGFNRTPESSGPAKPGESSGGAG